MKKLLLLLLCVPLLFSCGEDNTGNTEKEEKLQTIDTTYANGDRYVGEWKDGKRHGKGMEILNSGVKSEGKYKNGIKDGPWKSYYKNGQLKSEGNYSSSIQYTEREYNYTELGEIIKPIDYTKGIPDGLYKQYYENGNLSIEMYFSIGLPDSIARTYYENGQLETELNFQDGQRSGLCKFYYKSGELESEQDYYGISTDAKFYYKNGKLKSKGLFMNRQQSGYWDYYYENGQFKSNELWLNGEIVPKN
jgi:uncharacterized protein